MASTSSETPSPSRATAMMIGGFHASAGASESSARNCCAAVSAPAMSTLFTTITCAISISPAFIACTSSPPAGAVTSTVVCVAVAISTSS